MEPEPVVVAHPDILRLVVESAVMAPSTHNSQPWRFRIDGSLLEIFADQDRHLHVIDGDRRQQVQSCGCALYNARIAVRAYGFEDVVTVMLADAVHPGLLATLRLGDPRITTEDDRALFTAIPKRRTNRRPFLARPVAAAITDQLRVAVEAEGAAMARLEPSQKHQLGTLIEQADQLQYGDPAFRAEVAQWLVPFGSRRRDGIPFVEKEYGSSLPLSVMRALRSPELGEEFGQTEEHLVNGAPAVIVIGTRADAPSDWLACGEALQAVLLRVTALGLSASFLNQVLEIPGLRGEVAALVPGIGYPQMVLRIGVPEEAVHRAAPRRDVSDVLEVVTS